MKDLVVGADIRFTDRGRRDLKGLAEAVDLFASTSRAKRGAITRKFDVAPVESQRSVKCLLTTTNSIFVKHFAHRFRCP
jgi:hypothetical protein